MKQKIGYKLTDQNMCTYNNTQWELGVEKVTSGDGELCSSAFIHYYSNPLLAVIFNPIHADLKKLKLFECNIDGIIKDDHGTKYGCSKLTLINEIPLPVITKDQLIAFAILCAKEVYKEKTWNKWADNWLKNIDRSTNAAYTAYNAAYIAYNAAYNTAYAAYNAANIAAYTAYNAAYNAANAAYNAYNIANAAYAAAYAAAYSNINLIKIINTAIINY